MDTNTVYETIARELNKREGVAAKYEIGRHEGASVNFHRLMVNGIDASYWLEVKPEQVNDKYYGRFGFSKKDHPQGKLRVTVGSYGNRTSLPQKKDGSFSWDRIVDILLGEVRRRAAIMARDANISNNAKVAEDICKELGVTSYYPSPMSVRASESALPLAIEAKLNATVDQARRLHALLIEFKEENRAAGR